MTLMETFYGTFAILPSSFSFVLVILPLFLLIYYLVPLGLRPYVLLGESLFLYWWTGPALLWAVLSVALDYLALRILERLDGKPRLRRLCLFLAILKGAALLLFLGLSAQRQHSFYAWGIPVVAFSGMSCLIDAYRREIPCERNPGRFALYCLFFPKLYAGPLVGYEAFTCQLNRLELHPRAVLEGAEQFVQGVFKMSVLGYMLFQMYQDVRNLQEVTALSAWLEVFVHALALYFLLSGFSDMAKGMGGMYGIKLPQNFYYPYQSRSVEDFYDRFNITVGNFVRRYVYESWKGAGPVLDRLLVLATGILAGLWFGIRANYLLWGVYLALFVLLERHLYPALLQNAPLLFRRLGTLCVVLASFTIFVGETPAQSAALIRAMFRFSAPADEQVLYLLSSNWLLMVLSCFLATNIINLGITQFRRALPRASAWVLGAVNLGILVLYMMLNL